MNLAEAAKYALYRTPILGRVMAPTYPYGVNPAQLATMIGFIDATAGSGASVAEVGVGRGQSSAFLLEHMKTSGDPRELLLFDTFSGFTDESIATEVEERGKRASDYGRFRYGDEFRLRSNLRRARYSRFRTIKGDASRFDWSSISPIGAILLDVDLYEPTRVILNAIFPHLAPGGGIVVDDCVDNSPWDGSLQAYSEFTSDHGLPFERVGHKGGVIRKVPQLG